MIPTITIAGKLYTKRENLHTWDENYRVFTKEKMAQLKADRTDLPDLSPLLVMPDGLILGGTGRYIADEGIKDVEPIEVIDFAEVEGRWYAVQNGVILKDKKSWGTKYAAMKEISYKHNNNYGDLNADIVSADMANPALDEIDFDGIYQSVKDVNSLLEQVDSIAPNIDTDAELPSESLGLSSPEGNPDTSEPQLGSAPSGKKDNHYVKCPTCSQVFDPRRHTTEDLAPDEFVVPAALAPAMTTENSV